MAPALGPTYPVNEEEARRYGTSGNAPHPQARSQQRPAERPAVPPTAPRAEAEAPATVSGRGPRGYSRSDQRIFEDLCARIVDAGIDASETELQVKQGVARLEGTVLTRDDKWTLEDIATDVPGVVEVENRLYVRRQGADVTGR